QVRGGRAIIAPAAIFVGLIMITPRVLVFFCNGSCCNGLGERFCRRKSQIASANRWAEWRAIPISSAAWKWRRTAAAITASEKAGEIYRKRAAGGGPLARVR